MCKRTLSYLLAETIAPSHRVVTRTCLTKTREQLGELLVATTVFEAKPDRAQDATQEQTTAEADRYLQKESALLDPI